MSQKPSLMSLSVIGQKLLLEETVCHILIHMTHFYNFLAFTIFYNFHRQVMKWLSGLKETKISKHNNSK